jgi:hypothetical protein
MRRTKSHLSVALLLSCSGLLAGEEEAPAIGKSVETAEFRTLIDFYRIFRNPTKTEWFDYIGSDDDFDYFRFHSADASKSNHHYKTRRGLVIHIVRFDVSSGRQQRVRSRIFPEQLKKDASME